VTRWLPFGCLLTLVLSLALKAQTSLPLLPSAIAYDAQGDLFIADTNGNQILESSVAGALTVIAGIGAQGFAGDGGPATSALLSSPQGVAVAGDGTLYVADTANQRIRMIASSGIITTLVSSGLNNPTALALTASGTLLIADRNSNRVLALAVGSITTLAGTGIQGFSGDGGPATSASLDNPEGVAVGSDGRIWIADSHNQRIRVIATDGTIGTAAGTGVAGYSGDGAPATAARLSLPRGVSVLGDGTVVFADSNNQRLRAISSNGVISTVAGGGVQGAAVEAEPAATADLNNPRGAAASPLGPAAYADSANHLVRGLLTNQAVYSAAGLIPSRTSSVTLLCPATAVYGTPAGTITVQGVATPEGTVSILDGGAPVATGAIANGTASFALPALAAGSHVISATYGGDGFNPASVSGTAMISVSPAPAIATAYAATKAYGAPIPQLFGTVAGILSEDAATAIASFTTPATTLSPVGNYPILGVLSGQSSGNYNLSQNAVSGLLTITEASSSTTLETLSSSYAGVPWTMTATVFPAAGGSPSGTVTFQDGGVSIAKGILSGGVATGVYLDPVAGAHSIAANYDGDTNFLSSSSTAQVATIESVPDFSVASGVSAQTVQVGTIASYTVTVSSVGSPFSNPVLLSLIGLPVGVTPSFAPTVVIPGASGSVATLSFPTTNLLAVHSEPVVPVWLAWLPLGACAFVRRRSRPAMIAIVGVALLLSASGCGTRTVPDVSAKSNTLLLTIVGTGTNLAGAVISHSAVVTVTVE
jgi:sugar lactone lactonase YvrE